MTRVASFDGKYLSLYVDDDYKGSLRIQYLNQDACYVDSFCIDDINDRSKGHGTFLLNAAIELASQSGCIAFSLYVSESNERAIDFYKKNGLFIALKTRQKKYDGFVDRVEHHLLMTKKII